MTTWEYMELHHAIYWSHDGQRGGYWDTLIDALNELGQEGWECCGVRKNSAILKRPIDPQPQVINHHHYTIQPSPIQWDIPPVRCNAIVRALEHG